MRLYALAVATVVAVVVGTIACDRVPLTAPTASTITVSADQTTLPLNGQATVRAILIESGGTPVHNGTQVTFTTTLGSFNPPTSNTVDGVATSTFQAGSISGSTKINAFSGGASTGSGNSSSGGVTVLIGAAAAKTLAVSATPSTISQSGGTVTISALVMDESGNPLPGVNVSFSTDVGQLSSTIALSDASGVAKTTLATTQTAKVTATAGSAPPKDVTVTVSAAPTVSIDAPATALAGVPVAITIAAPTGTGARQLQSVTVDFGDGSSQTIQNPTGSVGLTHTYRSAGGFVITARSTDVAGNTGVATRGITITQPVPTVTVSASPSSGTAPFTSVVTITASAATGGPPLQSVRGFVNGEQVYSGTGSGSFSFRATAANSTYNVSVIATDTAGNESRANTIIVTQ